MASKRMKAFYRLWIGDSISDIGTAAYLFIVPVVAVQLFHANDSQLGLMIACLTAAPGLLAIPLGVFADRHTSPWALHGANAVRIALLGLLIGLWLAGYLSLVSLAIIALLVETASLFYDLVVAAIVPRLLPEDQRTRANSLVETGKTVTNSAGEVLGGLFLARFGFVSVLAFNLISCIANSIGVQAMLAQGGKYLNNAEATEETTEAESEESAPKAKGSVLAEIKGNIRYLIQLRPIFLMTINGLVFNIAIGVIITLIAPYALKQLEIPVHAYGLVSLPGVLICLTAPVVIGRVEKLIGTWNTVTLATATAGLAMLIIWSAHFTTGIAAAAIVSLGLAMLDYTALTAVTLAITIRQNIVPLDRQAGLYGLDKGISWGFDPLTAIVAGYLSAYVLGRELTIGLSAIFPILGALMLWIGGRALGNVEAKIHTVVAEN